MSQRLAGAGSGLLLIPVPDARRQIQAILADPDGYFARARAQAWRHATDEVNAELATRARARAHRNGHLPSPQPGGSGSS